MRGAFYVPEDQREIIKNKHIVIIDDVLTTELQCLRARCLKRNGAKGFQPVLLPVYVKKNGDRI